ncbi:MAG TPA: VOC family protein [Methylocystis sp.]|nr:VOC family protein [Methylocystis sp.]
MEQRISLVTLGVADVKRSVAFLERLGWCASAAPGGGFFQCGAMILCFYPREELAADAGVPSQGHGFAGFTFAHNTRSKEEVDRVLAEAQAAGATIVKPAQNAFWGGYSGYFRDPDGHLWEIAWNPGFGMDDAGGVFLPK